VAVAVAIEPAEKPEDGETDDGETDDGETG
jgi:hypothetical protein